MSPLIALQIDQLKGLAEHPRAPAGFAVNSSQSHHDNERALASVREPGSSYLFMSPEQLAKPDTTALLGGRVSLFVVDEAHLVSQWGHDFRPDYLELGSVVDALDHPPVLALTATGSPPVREEIQHRLRFRDARVLTLGFDRPNLHLEVVRHEDEQTKHAAVLSRAHELKGPGLIYVPTHHDADEYSAELVRLGVRASPYHAGHSVTLRRQTQQDFMAGRLDVVVATTAFGLGIDRANVRFVLHTAPSDSLDSYYQEAGRAGRDGQRALVELHYRAEDLSLRAFFAHGRLQPAHLQHLLEHLAGAPGPRTIPELQEDLAETGQSLARQVNLLREAGAVTVSERGVTRVRNVTEAHALTAAAEAEHEREAIDGSRLAMMRAYAETKRCRRQYLLGYFGEELPEPCGNCDTCDAGTAQGFAPEEATHEEFASGTAVRHHSWGTGQVMHADEETLTVYFDSVGYKVLSRHDVETRHLLTPI